MLTVVSLAKMPVIYVTNENGGIQKISCYWMSLCPPVIMTPLEFPMTLAFIYTFQNISPYFFLPFTFSDTYHDGKNMRSR